MSIMKSFCIYSIKITMKLADSRHGVMSYTPPSFNIISFTCFVSIHVCFVRNLLPYLRMISLGSCPLIFHPLVYLQDLSHISCNTSRASMKLKVYSCEVPLQHGQNQYHQWLQLCGLVATFLNFRIRFSSE